ncbi:LysM peptidoglycan-binding domain-containing protein [Sutcliffiella horikoshii]|uniref:LysM peptidoglycan-binding domain-containing protein n=2 Tax=Sutcliffiella horikoshii TaxID=79883 RepID=A0AA95B7J7_9BACI|nr:LysM peptidoglycan-binding domain-containing protein [Sutcliffiella horikoshii]
MFFTHLLKMGLTIFHVQATKFNQLRQSKCNQKFYIGVFNMKKHQKAILALAITLGLSGALGFSSYEPAFASSTDEVITIQKGDTLYSLSKKYDVTIDELKKMNELTSSKIIAGEKLIIKEATDIVVKKGDTLYSLAKTHATTVKKLKEWNLLNNNNIYTGQKLLVKAPVITEVKKGDTLYSLAKKSNNSVEQLKAWNNLTSDTIKIGQQLYLSPSPESFTITVKKGDTLYSLSKKYGTTVAALKELNELSSNTIYSGQKLRLN